MSTDQECPYCGAPQPPEDSGWTVIAVPAHARGPSLDPWDVDIILSAPELQDDFVATDTVEYGATLVEVFEKCDGYLEDFLVLATLAGHAAYGTTGICAAILALHAVRVAEAVEMEAKGADGDAIAALEANAYRRAVALLERLTVDLEERARTLHSAPPLEDVPPEIQALWHRQAKSAGVRAEHARDRLRSVEIDRQAAAAERDWYRDVIPPDQNEPTPLDE